MELEKNQIVTTDIVSLGYNGEGISKEFDKPIFIPYALKGEKVKVKIIFTKKDFYIGKIEEILIASKMRVKPQCEVFEKCGGCQLQHLDYSEQLIFKREHVEDCLKKIAGITFKADDTVPSKNKYYYRNKLALPVGTTNQNDVAIGMYANNSHRIINITDCPITQEWNKQIITVMKKFIFTYNVSVYNEENFTGIIRHIVVRKVGDKLSIIVVINGDKFKYRNELVKMFKELLTIDFCLYLNYNNQRNNVILGEKYQCLYGTNPQDNFKGIITEIHPNSFYQVNDDVKTEIYQSVLENIKSDENVIDAYSGAGTISNYLAKHFKDNNINKKVFSIEIIPQAVEGAKLTSKLNGLENYVTHILGDCNQVIPTLTSELTKSVVILDPPRKGCDKEVCQTLNQSECVKIIYISCDPSTLARDIKILSDVYDLKRVTPYDMFPNTKHIETLAILERKLK